MERTLITPDGRYLVVRGRLWRTSNPNLDPLRRQSLVDALMAARRAKAAAIRTSDPVAREQARQAVDQARHALGERGPVWWDDGTPDLNRHLVKNTSYAAWYHKLEPSLVQ